MDNIFDDMLNELNEARDQDKDIKQQREIKETVQRYRDKQKAKKRNLYEAKAPQMFYEMMEESPAPEPTPEPQYFREPELVVEEVRDTRSNIEKASEWISYSNKEEVKTDPQSIREGYDITERVRLLEQDLFRVQAQGKPQTLVAGIGASLDSGGGAVWLWDLEDVNIGVPCDGQYPSISDGQALVYDLDTNKWIPGAGGGGATDITDITAQFLEFDGDQTAQAIRASGASGKQFDIEVGETKATASIVARFEPQKLTLPSGQLAAADVNTTTATIGTLNTGTIQGNRIGVLWKLSAGDGLAFDGQVSGHIGGTPGETGGNAYSVGFGTMKVGPTVLQTTGSQIILGDKTYNGDTTGAKSLQTHDSVQKLIEAGGGGIDFNFKGSTNVTTTDPPSAVPGDYYSNSTAGNAGANWTGIANEAVALNQLVIYTSGNEWATGAEVDTSVYVPLAGTATGADITGNLVSTANITCVGLNSTNLTTTGSSTLGEDNADLLTVNGPSTFNSNVTLAQSSLSISNSSGVYISCTDVSTNPSTSKFKVEHNGTTTAEGIVHANAGIIVTNHQIKLLRAVNTNRFMQGVSTSSGSEVSTFEVFGSGEIKNSGDITTQGSNHTVGNFTLDGTVSSNLEPTGNQAYNLGKSGGKWNNAYINLGHFTNIDASGTLQVDGASTFNGAVTLGNSSSDLITFTGSVNSNILPSTNELYNLGSANIRWNNFYSRVINAESIGATSTITGDKFTATGNSSTSIFKAGTFSKQLTSSTRFEQSRTTTAGNNYFQIDGKITSNGSVNVLFEAVSGGANDADKILYRGPTTDGLSIQTKTSIQTNYMPPVAWTSLNQGAFESAGASTLTGHGTNCHYRVNPYTEMVDFNFYFQMDSAGSGFQQNQKIGFLPTAARPLSLKLTVPCVATDSGGNNQAYGFLELYTDGSIFIRELTGTSVSLYKLFAEGQWYGGAAWT